jgi:hypothetical protein
MVSIMGRSVVLGTEVGQGESVECLRENLLCFKFKRRSTKVVDGLYTCAEIRREIEKSFRGNPLLYFALWKHFIYAWRLQTMLLRFVV